MWASLLDESCQGDGSVKVRGQATKYNTGISLPQASEYSAHPLTAFLHVIHASSYFVTEDIEYR